MMQSHIEKERRNELGASIQTETKSMYYILHISFCCVIWVACRVRKSKLELLQVGRRRKGSRFCYERCTNKNVIKEINRVTGVVIIFSNLRMSYLMYLQYSLLKEKSYETLRQMTSAKLKLSHLLVNRCTLLTTTKR